MNTSVIHFREATHKNRASEEVFLEILSNFLQHKTRLVNQLATKLNRLRQTLCDRSYTTSHKRTRKIQNTHLRISTALLACLHCDLDNWETRARSAAAPPPPTLSSIRTPQTEQNYLNQRTLWVCINNYVYPKSVVNNQIDIFCHGLSFNKGLHSVSAFLRPRQAFEHPIGSTRTDLQLRGSGEVVPLFAHSLALWTSSRTFF